MADGQEFPLQWTNLIKKKKDYKCELIGQYSKEFYSNNTVTKQKAGKNGQKKNIDKEDCSKMAEQDRERRIESIKQDPQLLYRGRKNCR